MSQRLPTPGIEADPVWNLLTEALREGPGTPAWQQALAELRKANLTGNDDLELIRRVRELLESGRSFREIRAGREFTRNVMQRLDEPASRRRPWLAWALLATAMLAIGGTTAILIKAFRAGPAAPAGLADLESHTRTRLVVALPAVQGKWADWVTASPDMLSPEGIRSPQKAEPGKAPSAAWTRDMASDGPRMMLSLRVRPPTGEASPVNIALLDQPAGGNGLGILVESASAQVLARGGSSGPVPLPRGDRLVINLKWNQSDAIVEFGGRRVFAGPHQLAGPGRYLAIEFPRVGGRGASPVIEEVSLFELPQPK